MRKPLITLIVALLLAIAAPQYASADAYIGASYGYNTAISSSDNSWGGQVGVRIAKIIGLELGYIDLGEIGSSNAYVKSNGWTLSGAVYLPIPVVDLYLRGGGIKAEVSGNAGPLTADGSSETKGFYGLGAGLKLGPVSAFVEWDRYNLTPYEIDTTKVGVNLLF